MRSDRKDGVVIHEVILPKLGTNMEHAQICRWLVKEGQRVNKGDVIAEVDTDKAAFELESEVSGVVRRLIAADRQKVAVTEVIALIGDEGDDLAPALERIAREASERAKKPTHNESVRRVWTHAAAVTQDSGAAPKMSPAARGLLKKAGLDAAVVARHFGGRTVQTGDIEAIAGRKKLVIYGAGLGAKQVLEVTRLLDGFLVIGLMDDDAAIKGKDICGLPVKGGFAELKALAAAGEVDAVALSFHSQVRRKVHRRIRSEMPALSIPALVDPRAVVGYGAKIGDGALVEAGAVIGPDTVIGEGAIVDIGAKVAHDCDIGAFCHLSPGCTISGIVCLKEHVLVGVGAAVNSTTTIGSNSVVTPCSAVMNDVPEEVVVSGVPAQIIGRSRRGE